MTVDVTLFFSSFLVYFLAPWPKWKAVPLFFYGIPCKTTVAKDPNDSFLLLVWHQKVFHLYRSNYNLNCFLIHRYIYFPLVMIFVSLQTHQCNTDFKFTSENRGSKYAFVKTELTFIFTSQFFEVFYLKFPFQPGMISRNNMTKIVHFISLCSSYFISILTTWYFQVHLLFFQPLQIYFS